VVSTAKARVGVPSGNLPVDVTSFVGRRREITLTKRLLSESRVVTLTGPGGVGKTRLALRVAANVRRMFRDKVWCVGLEELRDPTLLAETVIEQLGMGGPSTGDTVEAIIEHLKNREILLVLDNCEHLLDDCALLVDAVVRWCPGVRVLATSIQSLGVAGESTMVVPPLQVPDPDHLPPPEAYEQYAAVRLFVDRARAVVPDFEVDAGNAAALMRLCHQLDGNPLAIEFAAVRLRSLSPHQLEDRVAERYELLTEGRRGAPARQRSLRALMDWTYDLCSPAERIVWARVSIFAGSFDLAAAEFVASGGALRADVFDIMHSLVDKSVLMREEEAGEVRFRLLYALREYGQERLMTSEDHDRVRQRHREWYARMIERFALGWLGGDQIAWMDKLRKEQDNIRAALHTAAISQDDATVVLRMVTSLGRYWGVRGLYTEARHWLDVALARVPANAPERVSALRVNAWLAVLMGNPETAQRLLSVAIPLADRHGDEIERTHVAQVRGMAALLNGELAEARERLSWALERFRELNVLDGELFALFALGLTRAGLGELDAGLGLLDRCLQRTAEFGELFWRSYALWGTARVEIGRGALDRAETLAKEALRLQRSLDNRLAMGFSLEALGWIAQRQGRPRRAARLLGASAAVWDAMRAGTASYAIFAADHEGYETRIRDALGTTGFKEAFDHGYHMTHEAALDYALEAKKLGRGAPRDNVHQIPLTRREQQIAGLVAQGRTNKDIAESLVIAQRTVEGHVQHILTKLDFTSRAQIAGWVASQQQDAIADAQ
jgi:predicted ATPase/DNA-binding NarL/FixJ family response regulator